jgi:hypothetical protein
MDRRPCPTQIVNVILPAMSTLAEIEAAADALPRAQQRKLLQHLAATLSAGEDSPKRSMHELMKDGCGIVDSGVPDLASNKAHLRGYGQ